MNAADAASVSTRVHQGVTPRGAGGQGKEQEPSASAESQAQPSGGGLPIDQIMAFAQNPNMQSGLALVGTLLSRRSQAQ